MTTFTYDAAGTRQTASLPNGTSTTWTVSDNSLIASHAYLWNAQGLRSRETSLTKPGPSKREKVFAPGPWMC